MTLMRRTKDVFTKDWQSKLSELIKLSKEFKKPQPRKVVVRRKCKMEDFFKTTEVHYEGKTYSVNRRVETTGEVAMTVWESFTSEDKCYTVILGERSRCTCPSFMYDKKVGQKCKHHQIATMGLVQLLIEAGKVKMK